MAKKYGKNMADTHLVVGSLEVIEEIKGNGIKRIQDKVAAIQETLNFIPEQVDYWSQLSNDGLITPVEKKTLKAQWDQIDAMYTKLHQLVVEKSLIYESYWVSYVSAFTNLRDYLNTTLGVFTDMTKNTAIPSREVFNSYFTLYYTQENSCSMNITGAGIGYQEYQFAIGDKDTHPAEDSTEWKDTPPSTIPTNKYLWMRTSWRTGVKGEEETTPTWNYAKMTGDKGETGTSFTPLYSDKNTPYLEDPTSWSETYNPQRHVYMCIKTVTSTGTTYSSPARFVGENGTSISILDSYDSYEDLIYYHPTGNVGDGYLVKVDLYVWLKNATTWKNVGSIQGPQGSGCTVTDTKIQYQLSTSGSEYIETAWVDDIPDLIQGYYLWTKTYVLFSDGSSYIVYSVSYIGKDADMVLYSMRISPTAVTFAEDGTILSGEKISVEKIRTSQSVAYQTDYGYITVQEDNGAEQSYGVSEVDTTGIYDSTKKYAAKYKPFLLQVGTDTDGSKLVLGISNEVAHMFFERTKE